MIRIMVCAVLVAGLAASAYGVTAGTSWSSYNTVIRDDGTNAATPDAVGTVKGDILGSDGLTNAELRIYQTDDEFTDVPFDVATPSGAFSNYFATTPSTNDPFSGLGGPGWFSSVRLGFRFYGAKSGIARGTDTRGGDETDGPLPPTLPGAPADIYDLQFHPENSGDQLTVFSFVVPDDGWYEIKNFAGRRWSDRNGNSGIRIYGPDGLWLGDPTSTFFQGANSAFLTVQGSDTSDWQIDPSSYLLPNLAAGDEIYFALHKNNYVPGGQWSFDGTEITFDVVKSPIPEPLTLVGLMMGGGALTRYLRRRSRA